MKKFLLGAVGLVALSMAAPASAADLAARPYTKAPPPIVAAVYDWGGFYIGANGGWGSSHKCWDITNFPGAAVVPPSVKVVTMRPAEWLAVRLATVGRAPVGCSVSKRRATGRI